MTHKQMESATPVVYLDAKKNLDKDIDLARFGARKDHVTVVIQRTLTTKRGDLRRIPILEITPAGDIAEIPAPRLRTSIGAHVTEADLALRLGDMNRRKAEGHLHLVKVVKVAHDYMDAKAEHELSRKQRRHNRRQEQKVTPHEREARNNRNTTTMLSDRAARKQAEQQAEDKKDAA